jgi:ATP-dependent metalloprotease
LLSHFFVVFSIYCADSLCSFDRNVSVTLPDLRARKGILELYMKDVSLSGTPLNFFSLLLLRSLSPFFSVPSDFGLRALAEEQLETLARRTTGFSGADLYNMVNTARIEGAKHNLDTITFDLLLKAREIIALGAHC